MKTELRAGYWIMQDWIDSGMMTEPEHAFTDGDLRLCAELIKYATGKANNGGEK